jgi:FAD/FMN-containing dehydrogenase
MAGRQNGPILAQGLKRSYGDAALLTGGRVIDMSRLDRMLDFDPATGWLRCEAGVSIADIAATLLPRGFFPPVVPGTKFVTVAGALASDIHGKNHHFAGSWSNHVRDVELLLPSGEIVRCDSGINAELFRATAGGQGLTGVVLAMDVRLERVAGGPPDGASQPAIDMETVRVASLEDFVRVSGSSAGYPYSVGWIDGAARGRNVGRGFFMRGRVNDAEGSGRAAASSGRPSNATTRRSFVDGRYLSFDWLLNRASMRVFNSYLYLRNGNGRRSVTFDHYFFPLDAVKNWNRFYGPRGFLQYQFVVPPDPQNRAMHAALDAVAASGIPSFLGVIKEFGPRANGGLSFPVPGTTVALDFPNTGARLLGLLERLDDMVANAGGRVYLAKDSRLGKDAFRRMYPEWRAWKATRDRYDPGYGMQSELGRRLGLVG